MNWGKGITIALIAFMSYIVYMAIVLMSKDTDLVSTDYYKNEVQFEQEINAQQNAINNKSQLVVNQLPKGLSIQLDTPDHVDLLEVVLYRANAKDDDVNVQSRGKNIFIEQEQLKKGRYLLTADWKAENKSFQMRDTLWIP